MKYKVLVSDSIKLGQPEEAYYKVVAFHRPVDIDEINHLVSNGANGLVCKALCGRKCISSILYSGRCAISFKYRRLDSQRHLPIIKKATSKLRIKL